MDRWIVKWQESRVAEVEATHGIEAIIKAFRLTRTRCKSANLYIGVDVEKVKPTPAPKGA